jgi:hypothetical protein
MRRLGVAALCALVPALALSSDEGRTRHRPAVAKRCAGRTVAKRRHGGPVNFVPQAHGPARIVIGHPRRRVPHRCRKRHNTPAAKTPAAATPGPSGGSQPAAGGGGGGDATSGAGGGSATGSGGGTTGTGTATGTTGSSGPTQLAHVGVTEGTRASEYTFGLSRSTVASGQVFIDPANHGQDDHDLRVVRLNSTAPPFDFPTLHPGESDSHLFDLAPGQYYLFCTLSDAGGTHESQGMHATLTVS